MSGFEMKVYYKAISIILLTVYLFSCEKPPKEITENGPTDTTIVDSKHLRNQQDINLLEGIIKFKLDDFTYEDTMSFLSSPNTEDIFMQFYPKDDEKGLKRFYFISRGFKEKISWEVQDFYQKPEYTPLIEGWEDYSLAYYFQVLGVDNNFLKVKFGADIEKYVQYDDKLMDYYSYSKALTELIPSAFKTDTLWTDTSKSKSMLLFDTLGYHCLSVSKMEGEWMYCSVYNPDDMIRDDYPDLNTKELEGWLKW